MLIALAFSTMAVAATDAPLTPTSKWQVEYADTMCVLSRRYGESKSDVTLGLRPYPMGTGTEIILATQGDTATIRARKVTVALAPSGVPTEGTYTRYALTSSHAVLTRITLPAEAFAGLDAATAMTIRLNGAETFTFGLLNIKSAVQALTVCQTELLRRWGIDPAEREQVVTPPRGDVAKWFGPDAYPSQAVRARQEGQAIAVLLVDQQGATRACAIAATSGARSLDHATCTVLQRARFSPGLDKDGKPTTAHLVVPVRWELP